MAIVWMPVLNFSVVGVGVEVEVEAEIDKVEMYLQNLKDPAGGEFQLSVRNNLRYL
jgi:hypothetical protein